MEMNKKNEKRSNKNMIWQYWLIQIWNDLNFSQNYEMTIKMIIIIEYLSLPFLFRVLNDWIVLLFNAWIIYQNSTKYEKVMILQLLKGFFSTII